METDARKTDVREVLRRHQVRYEVHPYYVVLDQHPVHGPSTEQRVQAGFDVDLYGVLDTWQLPLGHSEEAQLVVSYFESVAREVQSKAGHQTTVEVITDPESLSLDAHEHFRPEAMLRIRISHFRGMDQPHGPSEEQALAAIRETLHELDVKQG